LLLQSGALERCPLNRFVCVCVCVDPGRPDGNLWRV